MGANTTGMRKWRRYTASEGTVAGRPMDPNAPLAAKLQEEWLAMRFVARRERRRAAEHGGRLRRPGPGLACQGVR
eukprot:2449485-Prymnesium_polylepis.1